jgi:hypothetical protein
MRPLEFFVKRNISSHMMFVKDKFLVHDVYEVEAKNHDFFASTSHTS